MPTKPLDRLLFAQGGLCFFCTAPLPRAEASVEHLVASARGGLNGDDNCVACCKTMNALLGSMSLKEKIKVVLNQKGHFRCPNGTGGHKLAPAPIPPSSSNDTAHESFASRVPPEAIAAAIANLKSRGNARPRRLSTLAPTIKALANLGLTDKQVDDLIQHLRASGKITISNGQVSYKL